MTTTQQLQQEVAFEITRSLPPASSSPSKIDGGGVLSLSSSSSSSECHGFWREAALAVPAALFVLYLAFHAKKKLRKLSNGRNYVTIGYYALLWFAALLNLAWCSLQREREREAGQLGPLHTPSLMALHSRFSSKSWSKTAWQCSSGKEVAWNLLSLFTTAVMLSLEISLMAFLIQENHSTGFESLARAFTLSGVIVGVDMFLKAIFVFGFSVPLFFDGEETTHRMKWGLWTINKLLLAAVYGFILFVHSSKWQDKLPPRPMFYNYVVAMFVTNAVALFACTLSGIGFTFGLWLYNLTLFCYHSLYLPFLYITFSADIFQEEDLLLDNAYYSEMKDAGFFDVDWD